MSDILNKTIVLVLNRNWQAIHVRTPQEAFCMMGDRETRITTLKELCPGLSSERGCVCKTSRSGCRFGRHSVHKSAAVGAPHTTALRKQMQPALGLWMT